MQIALSAVVQDGSGSLTSSVQPVSVPGSTTVVLALTVKLQSGAAKDLTGCAVIFTARHSTRLGSTIVLSIQGIVDSAVGGLCHVTIAGAAMDNLRGAYDYDVTVVAADGTPDQVVPVSPFFVQDALYVPGQPVTIYPETPPLGQGVTGAAGAPGPTGPAGPPGPGSFSLPDGSNVFWQAGASGNATSWFQFNPNDGFGALWGWGYSHQPNGSGQRHDNVMQYGWNLNGGGVIDSTKGYLGFGLEDFWYNSNLNDFQSEWYISAGPPAAVGPGYRPIAINTSQTNPNGTKMLLTAHEVDIGAGAGPSGGQTQFSVTDTQLNLYSPDQSRSLLLTNVTYQINGPSNNATGTQTLFLFDCDPATQPGAFARFLGGVLPAVDRTYELGRYTDGASGRYRWSRVCASRGQFKTEDSLPTLTYNDIGSFTVLWDSAETTDAQPYVGLADVSSLGWFRLPTARAWAGDPAAQIASAATVTISRPIISITGTTTITQINLPGGVSAGGFGIIIPTGALPFNTGGNIGAAFTGTANRPILWVYDGSKIWLQ